jgi:choline dehydrogenase-like flavoprotein
MVDNPEKSVADRNSKVHYSRNVNLSGGEKFVTGAAVPPVLTIVAMTHRLSDYLLDRLQGV